MEPKQILIIDNDVFYQELLSDIFQQQGFLVKKASDGLEGLEIIKQEPFYCIFVDLIMPKIDGAKFIKCIREDPQLKETPVVLASGALVEESPYLEGVEADFFLYKGPAETLKKNVLEIIKKLATGEKEEKILGAESMFKRAVVKELMSLRRHDEIVLETIGEAVIETAANLRITYINPAGTKFFNKTEGQIIGCHLYELFDNESSQKIKEAIEKTSTQPNNTLVTFTMPLNKFILKIIVTNLIEEKKVTGTVLIAEDVTDYYTKIRELMLAQERVKKMQDKLIQDAKFSMLGQLSANISKEIENPLVSALSHISLLLSQKNNDAATREQLNTIQEGLHHARNMIRDLMDFGEEEQTKLERIDVSDILKKIVALVKNRADSAQIMINEDHEKNLPLIYVDSLKLRQVFINIINNAFEAMPNGGTLTLTITTTTTPDGTISVGETKEIVKIDFADTGIGIPSEILPQIFNPFFSAKIDKDATGLGLSTSLKIIQGFGGTIEAQSKVGEGSTFTIKIPVEGYNLV
ncbi:MAG TPA: ATP-binding protein [Thermodesulfobacteriota bacterium]|nr:ATP-binding protein [Thermodesulfobacteriota bacterium]